MGDVRSEKEKQRKRSGGPRFVWKTVLNVLERFETNRCGQERRTMKKIITWVLAAIMVGCLFAGCSSGNAGGGDTEAGGEAPVSAPAPAPEPEAPADSGIVVTDMTGREVRLDAPAEKVVALMAADAEILYAIGAGDRLVGRGEYCNYPPEILEVTAVQSGNETNIEQIIALQPQLLIMSKVAQDESQISQFEDAGITVFVSDAQDIEGTYKAIGLIGQLVGKEAEADAVIGDMKDTFAELKAKASANAVPGGEQKTIYFEVSPLEFGLWAAGGGTFMNEVAELIGLKNIFSDLPSWAEVSEEQVIERNPDYIMTVGMYFGDGPTPIESILSRPGWNSITAIKNKAILNMTEDELSRPGPRLATGAEMLYSFVYVE
jgi:iron complex transport system substrate-binding protein